MKFNKLSRLSKIILITSKLLYPLIAQDLECPNNYIEHNKYVESYIQTGNIDKNIQDSYDYVLFFRR